MFSMSKHVKMLYLSVSLHVFCGEIFMSGCTICGIETDCLDKNNTCLAGGVRA